MLLVQPIDCMDSTAELKPTAPQLTATEVRECTDPTLEPIRQAATEYPMHCIQLLYGVDSMAISGPYMYGIQLPRLHCKQLLFRVDPMADRY